jgi:hypothetical protein
MTQQIINVGANANDGTGEPLRNAFTAVNENFSEVYTAGPVGTNVKISGNIVTTTVTNLGLTLAGNGIGNIQANSSIVPGTAGVYDLGAPSNAFNYVYGDYFVGNGALLTGVASGNAITNGTSNVRVYANGNISISANGTSNVMVVSSQDVTITGNLTVTGNATLSGNIIGDKIQNGNTSFEIQTAGGNANISVGGVSNVAVFTTSGLAVTGNISANVFSGNGTGLTGVLADRGSDANNWDTLTQMGVYLVNRTSWSGTQGTPLDSQVFVGLLQVQTSQSQTTTQIFYPGQVEAIDIKIQWNRSLWASTWTPWVKMTNDGQLISGGVF